MADPESDTDSSEAARMELEPDAFHEEGEQLSVDCPQCGATVSIMHIAEEGRCPGYVDEEQKEGEGEVPRDDGCGANLSFELVWEA